MKTAAVGLAFALVAAVLTPVAVAQAAPNIPSSDLPGRQRQRFQDTPLDRYTDPLVQPRSVEPLWRWQCQQPSTSRRAKSRSKRRKGC
jgi:hypothetical protein